MAVTDSGKSKVILRGVKGGGDALTKAVRECMELCDWEQVVPPNANVVIKPNLCTAILDKVEMSNTDVALTEAVCKVLLTRTKRICLAESSGLRQTAWEAFEASGYVDMAHRLGVPLVNFTEEPWKKVVVDPAGEVDLPRRLLECDVFITLPVLKTHALTYFTGALKNQWGCVPQYDRILLHRYLDEMLVSLHGIFKPGLVIMDGIVGLEGRGPTNGKPRRLDLILASRDGVALDTTAQRLVGLDPMQSRHIVLAAKAGLGRMKEEEIELDGPWEQHKTQFEPAVLDKAIAMMNFMSRYRWFVKHMLEQDYIFYPIRRAVQFLRRVGVVEGGG